MTRTAIAGVLTALAALIVAVVALVSAPSTHDQKTNAEANLRQDAVAAAVNAQKAPTPACYPPPGAGHLGSCAPVQALASANALAKAAGDPDHVRGLLGVDTSSYQPCGYSLAGLDFAFFKATEGTGYTDRCLRSNVARAKRDRKPYGVYDFLRPGRGSAVSEAAHFVAAVRGAGANTSLPPVADVEANAGLNRSQINSYVCAWHRYVRRALSRKVSITYTGNWFWGPQVGGSNCGTVLWVSAYAPHFLVPSSWRRATIWQYSDGSYGPTPHLHGWDSDVWLLGRRSLTQLTGQRPAGRLTRLERKIVRGAARPRGTGHSRRYWCRQNTRRRATLTRLDHYHFRHRGGRRKRLGRSFTRRCTKHRR